MVKIKISPRCEKRLKNSGILMILVFKVCPKLNDGLYHLQVKGEQISLVFFNYYLPYYVLVLFVLALRVPPAAVHHGGVYVGGAVGVRLVQKRYNRQQYGADVLRRVPAFARQFPRLWIVYGRVQDADTQISILNN